MFSSRCAAGNVLSCSEELKENRLRDQNTSRHMLEANMVINLQDRLLQSDGFHRHRMRICEVEVASGLCMGVRKPDSV